MAFQTVSVELAPDEIIKYIFRLEIFGDIFDDAVKHELPALQTQHPGMYYEQAAQYAIARKTCCQDLCSVSFIKFI